MAGDNWTLIIALQLDSGRTRLSELRSRLSDVSAGVLDRYLRRMARAGLITRTRFREMPPRVEIELTEAGRELLPIAAALARWGARRAWSEPWEGERVDVEALLRMVPAMLPEGTSLPDATVELTLEEGDSILRRVFGVRDGRVVGLAMDEPAAREPSVRIGGDRPAWTAALGPRSEARRLRLAGDRRAGERILAALAHPAPPRS